MDPTTSEISLEYPEPKPTGSYVIPSLGLHDGIFLYSYISAFLSYITPHDLPVEILRDAFHAKVSVVQLVLEALKVESGFICLMGLFFIVSLIPLASIIVWGCSKGNSSADAAAAAAPSSENGEVDNGGIVDSVALADETRARSLQCQRKCLVITLQIILLLLTLAIVMMFVTNEQTSSAIEQTPMLIRSSLKDIETFLKDIHHQLIFTVFEGLNTLVDRVKIDLEGIDKLLGEPIQQQLQLNTGLDSIFEALMDICTSSSNLSHRIFLLHETLQRAIQMINEAEHRLEEIEIQLSVLQRQCTYRDRPLCDTLRMRGIEESGVKDKLRKLQIDLTLNKLKAMGDIEGNSVLKNLTDELSNVRSRYRSYSLRVLDHTGPSRDRIVEQLAAMRDKIQLQTRVFTSTIKSVVDKIDQVWGFAEPMLARLGTGGFYLWVLGLTAASVALFGTLMYLTSLSCECCQWESKARVMLVISAVIVAISSVVLVLFSIVQLIVGGHAEFFICRPLFDAPSYSVLSRLVDKPGLVYASEPPNGILAEIFKTPDLSSPQSSINVSLSEAISECQAGGSAYDVFDLNALLNLTTVLDFDSHPGLLNELDEIIAPEGPFVGLTATMQKLLQDMVTDSALNLTSHRLELVQVAPEKDLTTFIDQMQRVSLQIQDTATTSRMTTLGTRAKRIQMSLLAPFEQLRGDIVYHLTALELQIKPWAQQVNKSLNHLKTAQFYLDHEAANVCSDRSESFRNRLKNHVSSYFNHTFSFIEGGSTTCRPIFDIFHAVRSLFCRHIVDPINGLWFCSIVALLMWILATPIALVLASVFRQIHSLSKKIVRNSSSYRQGSRDNFDDSIVVAQDSGWSARSQVAADIDRTTDDITLVRRGADPDLEVVQIIFDDEEVREELI